MSCTGCKVLGEGVGGLKRGELVAPQRRAASGARYYFFMCVQSTDDAFCFIRCNSGVILGGGRLPLAFRIDPRSMFLHQLHQG
jgi:hypothetical protein